MININLKRDEARNYTFDRILYAKVKPDIAPEEEEPIAVEEEDVEELE